VRDAPAAAIRKHQTRDGNRRVATVPLPSNTIPLPDSAAAVIFV
jgi:hypothetical protein